MHFRSTVSFHSIVEPRWESRRTTKCKDNRIAAGHRCSGRPANRRRRRVHSHQRQKTETSLCIPQERLCGRWRSCVGCSYRRNTATVYFLREILSQMDGLSVSAAILGRHSFAEHRLYRRTHYCCPCTSRSQGNVNRYKSSLLLTSRRRQKLREEEGNELLRHPVRDPVVCGVPPNPTSHR